ncbi:MAG: hypothetical protein EOM26_05150 [Alphaproteobacteria bacterium]|nr:hypothetical protein [Alphaproteobacteria bacterium]
MTGECVGPNPEETAVRQGLKTQLNARAPELASRLIDEDVDALLETGHLTLKRGNCTPPYTIVTSDIFQGTDDSLETKLFPEMRHFKNAWAEAGYLTGMTQEDEKATSDDQLSIRLQLSGGTIRLYHLLMRIRNALLHQDEYVQEKHSKEPFPSADSAFIRPAISSEAVELDRKYLTTWRRLEGNGAFSLIATGRIMAWMRICGNSSHYCGLLWTYSRCTATEISKHSADFALLPPPSTHRSTNNTKYSSIRRT